MEKYIFICELLVTKYMDSVTKEMAQSLLRIYSPRKTVNFTKAIWFKMLKTLACLKPLVGLLNNSASLRETLMQFSVMAYKATADPLSFLYFMKTTMLLT
jgi:hypothetical protein